MKAPEWGCEKTHQSNVHGAGGQRQGVIGLEVEKGIKVLIGRKLVPEAKNSRNFEVTSTVSRRSHGGPGSRGSFYVGHMGHVLLGVILKIGLLFPQGFFTEGHVCM